MSKNKKNELGKKGIVDKMTVDRHDIERLHEKIDKIGTEVTEIKTTLKVTPIPKQPCEFLKEHKQRHKEEETLWRRPIVGCIIDLIKMGIVFLIAFLWGKHK